MSISPQKRQKIVDQCKKEIDFNRRYKQGKISNWQKNEAMYYGRKEKNNLAVANVELGKMSSFVHTVLSKIDSPLSFEFKKATHADLKRATLMNALKETDSNHGDWDFKDILGKKQGIIYGRAIYLYYADSIKGQYKSHLENIDVYDFLIDPAAGGSDIEQARNLGYYGVTKTRTELKEGDYIQSEVKKLLSGSGNETEVTQEETNKQNRYSDLGTQSTRQIDDVDLYKFWAWFTTYEDVRYYVVMNESGACIRIERLDELFKDGKYPFWTWACFVDLTEFWTPSYCDYVRELYMAQSVSINQLLDNAEKRNKPQRLVNATALESLGDLVYRPNGLIRVKNGRQFGEVYHNIEVPSLNTPIEVYNLLEGIGQVESGVTADARGSSEQDKVTIYEGNMAQAADRFGLLNKSYSQGYKRFAKLYMDGVEWHLTKKVAVRILGPDGLEKTVFIGKRDIKPSQDFDILVKSSNAEAQSDAVDKKNKLTFLTANSTNQLVNQKKLFEITADISGFDADTIRSLLDVSEYGEADLMSEADRDIESLLDKKIIDPNAKANNSYRKRIVEYMQDHYEDMDTDTFLLFKDYVESLEPIIITNMTNMLQSTMAKEGTRISNTAAEDIDPLVQGQTEQELQNNEPPLQ